MLANTVGEPPGDSPAATADSSASTVGSGLFAWQAAMWTRNVATAARLGLTSAFYLAQRAVYTSNLEAVRALTFVVLLKRCSQR